MSFTFGHEDLVAAIIAQNRELLRIHEQTAELVTVYRQLLAGELSRPELEEIRGFCAQACTAVEAQDTQLLVDVDELRQALAGALTGPAVELPGMLRAAASKLEALARGASVSADVRELDREISSRLSARP